uniref:Uncharacterized protein n=1 Tax=Anguilla anguilla TaxID=7936 RepID=A0A0E9WMG6_ANGAN
MESRLKVLRVFKALHKTRMDVFRDDIRALTAARQKITKSLEKTKKKLQKKK